MSAGRALMLLMPSEQKGMLAQLEEAKVIEQLISLILLNAAYARRVEGMLAQLEDAKCKRHTMLYSRHSNAYPLILNASLFSINRCSVLAASNVQLSLRRLIPEFQGLHVQAL
eukprot:scaffold82156_cov19-Tisochrysis_lutea.AAC.1